MDNYPRAVVDQPSERDVESQEGFNAYRVGKREDPSLSLAGTQRRLMALSDLAAKAASGLPVVALLEEVVDLTALTLDSDMAALLEYIPDRNRLSVRATWGIPFRTTHLEVSTERTSQAGYTMLTKSPVLSLDTSHDPRFGLPDELRESGLRGALSVPVRLQGDIWGVLIVASHAARHFAASDLRFLQSAANIMAVTLDRMRTASDRDQMQTRLDLALGSVNLGIWEYQVTEDRFWVSPTMERMLGLGPGEFDGSPSSILDRVPDDELADIVKLLRKPVGVIEESRHTFRLNTVAGVLRWFEVSARSIVSEDGSIDRVVGVAVDITDRHDAEEINAALMVRADEARNAAVDARERFAFLASVGAHLAEQLESSDVASVIVSDTVGRIADYCLVDLYSESGEIVDTISGHVDPTQETLLREAHFYEVVGTPAARDISRHLYERRRVAFHPVLTSVDVCAGAVNDEHADMLRSIGMTSSVLLPLIGRGQLLGGIALGRIGDAPAFDDDDLTLLKGVAARAAIALDNARLYQERAAVVRSLQATLIPPALPEIEGVELAACYRVAEGGIDIGGDFYDAFPVSDTAYAVVIGDVSGKGPSAAGVTGVVRQSLRAVAPRLGRPSDALATANSVLLPQVEETRFCTAILVRLEPCRNGVDATICNAGHPRPYVVSHDGRVSVIPAQGTLLGVMQSIELEDVEVHLDPGDSIVMVTDGVTEARAGTEELGEDGVLEGLAGVNAKASAAEIADVVVAHTAAYSQGIARDDLAVIVIRASDEPLPGS